MSDDVTFRFVERWQHIGDGQYRMRFEHGDGSPITDWTVMGPRRPFTLYATDEPTPRAEDEWFVEPQP